MTFPTKPVVVGDIVCLAGTPMRMMVTKQRFELSHCKWYDAEGQENEYPFITSTLEHAEVQGGRFPGRR
jgi:uncharacterized protein YodC (DUF2158 family)